MKIFCTARSLSLVALALIGISGLFLVLGVVAGEVVQTKEVRVSWSPPLYGTPVHHYVLKVWSHTLEGENTVLYEDIMDTLATVEVESGGSYRACVAGVDSLARQGGWSRWTPIYSTEFNLPEFRN